MLPIDGSPPSNRGGVPKIPSVSIGADPTDDFVFISSSEGEAVTLQPPLRDSLERGLIFWRQLF